MAGKNGSGGELKLAPRKVVDIPLDSGVTARVTPLNRNVVNSFNEKAAKLFPAPDPKQYELPLPEGAALDPNMKQPAIKNPEYIRALKLVSAQRDVYIMTAVYETAVEWLDTEGNAIAPETLIAHFADTVAKIRQYSDILPTDPWQATLYGCVAKNDEGLQIVRAARAAAPLERGEVLAEVATFRLKVPGQAVGELDTGASGVSPQVPSAEQHGVG